MSGRMEFAAVGYLHTPHCISAGRSSASRLFFSSSVPPSTIECSMRICPRPVHISCKNPLFCHSNPSKCPNPHTSQKTLSLRSFLRKSISFSIFVAYVLFARSEMSASSDPSPPPPIVESPSAPATVQSEEDAVSETEREKTLEEHSDSHPDDVNGLESLLDIKIRLRKLPEAINVVQRLILLQPSENIWPIIRAHLLLHAGDVSAATSAFEDIISGDPFSVGAYHGLLLIASQSDPGSVEEQLTRVYNAMEKCRQEKKSDLLQDFTMLVALVKVTQSKYEEALSLYKQISEEDIFDFRPHLCQGLLCSLMGKKDEADEHFQMYQLLVPPGHPVAEFPKHGELATQVISQLRNNLKERSGKST